MGPHRLPFGRTLTADKAPEQFDPGHALAAAAEEAREPGTRVEIETPWGALSVEARDQRQLVVATPRARVAQPSVMLAVAAMKLGLPRARVEATGTPIQVIDVGRPILVVPVESAEDVRNAPAAPDLAGLPSVTAHEGIIYARTQRTPYVKLLARTWHAAEPLAPLAAAAMHLVANRGVKATYPRTRVVGELVEHEDERAEITLVVKSVSGAPKVERILVGGAVLPADEAGKD